MKLLRLLTHPRVRSLTALAIMAVALGIATPTFLTWMNLWNILRQISVNLCLSIGMTLVVLIGGIDLSVGAVLAFAGATAAKVLHNAGPPESVWTTLLAIVAAIAAGAGFGLLNGISVTQLKLPAFVATLAMLSIARGLTLLWTGALPITGLPDSFGFIGTGFFLGVPVPVWIVAILVALAIAVTTRTVFGRHIYAIGGSERASRLTGIAVNRVKLLVYLIGGALAGLGGVMVTARLDSAQPAAGSGYELDSIAAVVIGGTSLSGGRGSILGTALGCLIIGVLNNGLFLLEISPFWQQIIKGLVILGAVAIDRMTQAEGLLSDS